MVVINVQSTFAFISLISVTFCNKEQNITNWSLYNAQIVHNSPTLGGTGKRSDL